MPLSAAAKRLNRILADEEYGPMLVHLNKADERKVLDLLDRPKSGREARKLITQLDEDRRVDRRIRDRVRQFIRKTPIERSRERPVDETRRFWQLYDRGMTG